MMLMMMIRITKMQCYISEEEEKVPDAMLLFKCVSPAEYSRMQPA